MRVLMNVAPQYVSVCILNLPRHFFHRPLGTLRAWLYLLAGRGTLYRRHGNTDQYQRVLESGICGALAFCPCPVISSIAPMEPLTLLPLLAGWWWPRNLRDGKYGWLQHLQ